jgi:hypothetical protein
VYVKVDGSGIVADALTLVGRYTDCLYPLDAS